MTFVIDASVALAWVFIDERTEFTNAVLGRLQDTEAVVPVVWPLEILNVLVNSERRGRISSQESSQFLQFFTGLPIAVDDNAVQSVSGSILAISRSHGLSAYDASYIELAIRLNLPLATLDSRLGAAATQLNLPAL